MSGAASGGRPKLLFVVTEDWYFCSHRLPLARAARDDGFEVLVATRVDRHGDRIRDEGLRLIPLRLRRRRSNPWNELASIAELVGVYRSEKPDIVHHVAMKPVIYGTLAALVARVPRIVNALAGFGYIFTSSHLRARLLRPLVRGALRRLLNAGRGRTIVQNPDDARTLGTLGIPDERIVIIPGSGVDTTLFHPETEPEGPVVACMVARMLWDKGVGELATAARQLKSRLPTLRVWLVGPPDPENPASIPEATLDSWAEEGILEWLGQRDDVAELWRSGCREVAVEGETGLLVPARDPAALAGAIERLAGDGELRRRLGAAARERVVDRFSQERIAADTVALYRSLLAP
jgi:glycosyltransferase involved in cell wall biosynthesis